MPRLREAFPRLRLWLREDAADMLADRLAAGRLDLLVIALPGDCGGAETLPIAEDPFLVALPAGHRLAGAEAIAPEALAGERLLLLEQGHCLRDHALLAAGLPSAGAVEGFAASSLHTLLQMVGNGLGVTLLPRLAMAGGAAAPVVLRPLDGGFARRISLAWRAGDPRAEAFRALAPTIAAALDGL